MVDGGKAHMDLHDWERWDHWSVVLGFPVMGIWPDFSDGTDVNRVATSRENKVVVTADDFGGVKMFNFPCLVEDAPYIRYPGHSSHVSSVAFLGDDRRVVSTGSADRAVFVWRFNGVKKATGEDSEDEDDGVLPDSQIELVKGYELQMERAKEEELRRSLTDPFTALRGRGGGVNVSEEVRDDIELLSRFLGDVMRGIGGDVGALARNSVELKGTGEGGGKRKKEKEKVKDEHGVKHCVGTGYDVEDEELKKLGLWEIEKQGRQERKLEKEKEREKRDARRRRK